MLKLLMFGKIVEDEDEDENSLVSAKDGKSSVVKFLTGEEAARKNKAGQSALDIALKLRGVLLDEQPDDDEEDEVDFEQRRARFEDNEKIIALLKAFSPRKLF